MSKLNKSCCMVNKLNLLNNSQVNNLDSCNLEVHCIKNIIYYKLSINYHSNNIHYCSLSMKYLTHYMYYKVSYIINSLHYSNKIQDYNSNNLLLVNHYKLNKMINKTNIKNCLNKMNYSKINN